MKPLVGVADGSASKDENYGPDLVATLPLMIGGFFVRVANNGDAVAHNVHVEVVSWGNGAPEANIQTIKRFPDMPPGYDTRVHVDLFDTGTQISRSNEMVRASSSGYIVVTCSNCEVAKSWAFYIPEEGSELWSETSPYTGNKSSWPLAEFDFATEKPPLSVVVNHPWNIDDSGWHPPPEQQKHSE